jgi:hypothetical protein
MSWRYQAQKKKDQAGPIPAYIVFENGDRENLTSAAKHSPDGFQMGYRGSGPSEFAYSILLDYFVRCGQYGLMETVDKAERYYQQFKNDFIVPAKELFVVDSNAIRLWVDVQENF